MARFIILRGPMGAGKSKVGKYLAKALDDSFLLDLDLNANCPIEGLNEALGHKNIVAELYHGNSHTTDPKPIQWTTQPSRISEKNDLLLCIRGSTTGKMNWSDQRYCFGRGPYNKNFKQYVYVIR